MSPHNSITEKMKPERSERKILPDNWTIHPPYIALDFEYEPSTFTKAMKFAAVVLDSAKAWGVEVEYYVQRGVLTFEISPAKGSTLEEKAFEFARGIEAVYHFVHSGPAPEES